MATAAEGVRHRERANSWKGVAASETAGTAPVTAAASPLIIRPRRLQRLCPGSRPPFKLCIVETATARNRSTHSISVWHQLLITGDLFSFGPLLF